MPGKLVLSTCLAIESISHAMMVSIPACLKPSSNPPIPANKLTILSGSFSDVLLLISINFFRFLYLKNAIADEFNQAWWDALSNYFTAHI